MASLGFIQQLPNLINPLPALGFCFPYRQNRLPRDLVSGPTSPDNGLVSVNAIILSPLN